MTHLYKGVVTLLFRSAGFSEITHTYQQLNDGGNDWIASLRGCCRQCAPHPTPYTLHPTPHTLHPTPHTLQSTPYTLHPTPYTLHPTSYTLNYARAYP